MVSLTMGNFAFPFRDGLPGHAQPVGQLLLRKALCLSEALNSVRDCHELHFLSEPHYSRGGGCVSTMLPGHFGNPGLHFGKRGSGMQIKLSRAGVTLGQIAHRGDAWAGDTVFLIITEKIDVSL